MLRFVVVSALVVLLAGCQMTRDREKDSQKEFDEAVKQQHKSIASICEKIESDVQRRRCLGE